MDSLSFIVVTTFYQISNLAVHMYNIDPRPRQLLPITTRSMVGAEIAMTLMLSSALITERRERTRPSAVRVNMVRPCLIRPSDLHLCMCTCRHWNDFPYISDQA